MKRKLLGFSTLQKELKSFQMFRLRTSNWQMSQSVAKDVLQIYSLYINKKDVRVSVYMCDVCVCLKAKMKMKIDVIKQRWYFVFRSYCDCKHQWRNRDS